MTEFACPKRVEGQCADRFDNTQFEDIKPESLVSFCVTKDNLSKNHLYKNKACSLKLLSLKIMNVMTFQQAMVFYSVDTDRGRAITI